jgi:CheY-like chemotaxis protein
MKDARVFFGAHYRRGQCELSAEVFGDELRALAANELNAQVARIDEELRALGVEPNRGNGCVLLVQPDQGVRIIAAEALASHGYGVLEAASGLEALEVMTRVKGCVDIVASELVLTHEMDGATLLSELRKTNPDLKFIFVTGYPEDAVRDAVRKAARNQVYAFFAKPFTGAQLVAKVKEQLARRDP